MVQLFIPYFDARQTVPNQPYNCLKEQLTGKFGGISMWEEAPVTGLWKSEEQSVQKDRLLIFEVLATTMDTDY